MSTGVIVAFIVGLIVGLLVAWLYFRQKYEPKLAEMQAALSQREQRLRRMEATPDDFQRIEGIGPKIAQVLQAAGISTYQQLAATEVSRLERILADAGLTMADPGTWPEQARLAAAGDWAALEKLQEELSGGRRA